MNPDEVHTIEQMHCVYLLYCLNPKFKGRTYIGYTVDPNRRIKQHNKGKKAGGAWRTSMRGPWSMVLIVHGFPNDISALRFEWAWQHPDRSRRLGHLAKKHAKESSYDFALRIVSEMLRVGPWNRLPLTIRWLNLDYERKFLSEPPLHMPLCYGPVISKKLPEATKNDRKPIKEHKTCDLCLGEFADKAMLCPNPVCDLKTHLTCLADRFLQDGEHVPVEGRCPSCDGNYLWGDYVRKYKGCYGNLDVVLATDLISSESE